MRPAQTVNRSPHRDRAQLLAVALGPPGAVLQDRRIWRRLQPGAQNGFLLATDRAGASRNRLVLQGARLTLLHHGRLTVVTATPKRQAASRMG